MAVIFERSTPDDCPVCVHDVKSIIQQIESVQNSERPSPVKCRRLLVMASPRLTHRCFVSDDDLMT